MEKAQLPGSRGPEDGQSVDEAQAEVSGCGVRSYHGVSKEGRGRGQPIRLGACPPHSQGCPVLCRMCSYLHL